MTDNEIREQIALNEKLADESTYADEIRIANTLIEYWKGRLGKITGE